MKQSPYKNVLLFQAKVNDAGHIKEAVARIVIEVAKREFPQNWENFLPQLGELQTRGVFTDTAKFSTFKFGQMYNIYNSLLSC